MGGASIDMNERGANNFVKCLKTSFCLKRPICLSSKCHLLNVLFILYIYVGHCGSFGQRVPIIMELTEGTI